MSNVFDFRDAIVKAAAHSFVDEGVGGDLLAAAMEFYLGLHEQMAVREVLKDEASERPPAIREDRAAPVFEGSGVPGPERAPVPTLEPEPEWPELDETPSVDGPRGSVVVVDAKDGDVSLEEVPACFHCGVKAAKYCSECYHERHSRKTSLGTGHQPPDGYALLATRWCTESGGVREGYETIDGVVSSWAQSDDANATFFVLERVHSEGEATYRIYIYAKTVV